MKGCNKKLDSKNKYEKNQNGSERRNKKIIPADTYVWSMFKRQKSKLYTHVKEPGNIHTHTSTTTSAAVAEKKKCKHNIVYVSGRCECECIAR